MLEVTGGFGHKRGFLRLKASCLFVFSWHNVCQRSPPENTAACDHPRPRARVETLLALGIGGFVTGPAGPETWQPSRCSTPSLGAWPCLRGASAPALPVHQGAQCDVVWGFTRSKIGPAGIGLMVSRSPYQGLARVLLSILAVISLRSAGPGYEVNFDAVSILVTVPACDCSTPCRGAQLCTQLHVFSHICMYAPRPRLCLRSQIGSRPLIQTRARRDIRQSVTGAFGLSEGASFRGFCEDEIVSLSCLACFTRPAAGKHGKTATAFVGLDVGTR